MSIFLTAGYGSTSVNITLNSKISTDLCMMDCRMEAKGVTPIPVPMSTACWAWKMRLVGAPNGPSMNTWRLLLTWRMSGVEAAPVSGSVLVSDPALNRLSVLSFSAILSRMKWLDEHRSGSPSSSSSSGMASSTDYNMTFILLWVLSFI